MGSQAPQKQCTSPWMKFGNPGELHNPEGKLLSKMAWTQSPAECEKACDKLGDACQSITICGNDCKLRDVKVFADDTGKKSVNLKCQTYFKCTEQVILSAPPPPVGPPACPKPKAGQ